MEKLIARVPKDLKEAVRAHAKSTGCTMSDVVRAALDDFFNPDEYKTASLKHLSEINRKLDLVLRREELTTETVGRFLLVYLMHTPALPDDERRAATADAKRRWHNFNERLARSLALDKTFMRAVEDAAPSPLDEYFHAIQDAEDDDAT